MTIWKKDWFWACWNWLRGLFSTRVRCVYVRDVAAGAYRLIEQNKGEDMLTLTDIQKCALTVAFQTAAGNPAKVDGAPQWSVSDEALLELQVAEDGMSATVTAKGPLGIGQVLLKADADLGEGVKEITGLLDVEVIASEATVAIVAAGAPEPK